MKAARLPIWILAGLTAVASSTGAATTTFDREARAGDRLEVRNYRGSVRVVAWDEPRLRVEAEHRASEEIVLERRGSKWLLVPVSWQRDSDEFELRLPDVARVRVVGNEPPTVDLIVSMPAEMALVAESPHGDISVEGVRGSVELTTMLGDLTVSGSGSPLRLTSMIGQIEVQGARGRTTVEGATGSVTVRESAGELRVETTTGEVVLEELATLDLEVTTLGGDIELRGSLTEGGRYDLSSHSGDVELALGGTPNAHFSVRAFRGDFASDLLAAPPSDGSRTEFTLGDGSARVRLQSFSGHVRIDRAEEP